MLRLSDPLTLRPDPDQPSSPWNSLHTSRRYGSDVCDSASLFPLARIYRSVTRKGPPVDPTDLA